MRDIVRGAIKEITEHREEYTNLAKTIGGFFLTAASGGAYLYNKDGWTETLWTMEIIPAFIAAKYILDYAKDRFLLKKPFSLRQEAIYAAIYGLIWGAGFSTGALIEDKFMPLKLIQQQMHPLQPSMPAPKAATPNPP